MSITFHFLNIIGTFNCKTLRFKSLRISLLLIVNSAYPDEFILQQFTSHKNRLISCKICNHEECNLIVNRNELHLECLTMCPSPSINPAINAKF